MSVLDLFFPSGYKCIFCGCETSDFGVCPKCDSLLPYITGSTCSFCGTPISNSKVCFECAGRKHYFDGGFSVFNYVDQIREKIISFKSSSNKYIGLAFARILASKVDTILKNTHIDLVIPVPNSKEREKERGFNQCEILCSEIDSVPVDFETLKRIKNTPHQTGLDRKNRETNLLGAFGMTDASLVAGKSILLVDDIYTTGSTLNECAMTLKKAGAGRVYVLTLARTPIRRENILL